MIVIVPDQEPRLRLDFRNGLIMTGTTTRLDLPLTVDPSLRSIGHLLRLRIEQTPHRRAFTFPDQLETWHAVSWRNLGDEVSEVASGLLSLGVSPGERIAIASTTRYEWAVAAYAIACSGAATVAVYPSTIEEDVAFIIGDSGSTIVFADDADQLRKLTRIREQIPQVHTVVMLDNTVAADLPDGTDPSWVISFEELRARGIDRRKERPHEVDARIDSTNLEDLATLIYTSGTTGQPKGVLLPHRVWVHEVHALDETANASGSITPSRLRLSRICLPYSSSPTVAWKTDSRFNRASPTATLSGEPPTRASPPGTTSTRASPITAIRVLMSPLPYSYLSS